MDLNEILFVVCLLALAAIVIGVVVFLGVALTDETRYQLEPICDDPSGVDYWKQKYTSGSGFIRMNESEVAEFCK